MLPICSVRIAMAGSLPCQDHYGILRKMDAGLPAPQQERSHRLAEVEIAPAVGHVHVDDALR